jgi:dienelactone hydrolase
VSGHGARREEVGVSQIDGFELGTFEHGGRTHDVYRAGTGPAVVVIHEIPGLHPGVIAFGRRLVELGYTAYMPSLFGRPNAEPTGREIGRSLLRTCVSREFTLLADRTQPAVHWLRALAAKAHQECGGPGVGAVGMCFTGGFALAMAVEPAVLAPVLSQPGMPAPVSARKRAALGLDPADLTAVKARTKDGLCLLGLRFSADRGSPGERFARMRQEFGEAFEGIEIDSSEGNPYGIKKTAHSVLTIDLVDEPGHPTREALDRVLAFLAQRLKPSA